MCFSSVTVDQRLQATAVPLMSGTVGALVGLSVSSDPSGSSHGAGGGDVAAGVGAGLDVEPASGSGEREDVGSGVDEVAAVGWRVELVVSSGYLAVVLEVGV